MSVLEAAIGWLAPPQCISCGSEGSALCKSCSTSVIKPYGERCAFCAKLSACGRTCQQCRVAGAQRFVWIKTTYNDSAQNLLQVYKFRHLRAAAEPLSLMMTETLRAYIDPDLLIKMNYLVVPLPTATSRIRQRGFDHSALLARSVARKLKAEYAPALGRLGQSRQVGATRQMRLQQQSRNYFARQSQRIAGRNILLIDDVVTTGGSLVAAGRALRAAGANHVDALVFAKRL